MINDSIPDSCRSVVIADEKKLKACPHREHRIPKDDKDKVLGVGVYPACKYCGYLYVYHRGRKEWQHV